MAVHRFLQTSSGLIHWLDWYWKVADDHLENSQSEDCSLFDWLETGVGGFCVFFSFSVALLDIELRGVACLHILP